MLKAVLVSLCLLMSVEAASTPRPLADVTVPTPDGKKVHLGQYRGKVMVVALVSTTCDHCIASLQMLRFFTWREKAIPSIKKRNVNPSQN